jgi:YbbR domain-containing protein
MTADYRVKVTVILHENHSRPNISLQLLDADGNELARSFIINVIDQQTDFTLHLKHPQPKYPLRLRSESFTADDVPIDFKEVFLES